MTKPRTLNISLHNEKIGTLTLLPNEQTIFTFDAGYVNNSKRATLSLSFENKQGDFEPFIKPSRRQLPSFFSNLLPEGPLRHYLANRAGVNAKREFFLLWALGGDLPGAVTAFTDGDSPPAGNNEESHSFTPDFMRFSLAGVQLKFSGILHPKGGLTIPAKGIGGSWIIKLPSPQYVGVPENEFSMMTLAHKMGMNVPSLQLVALDKISGLPDHLGIFKGGEALAVKRFDRTDNGGRVHMEDFAQIFGVYPIQKYEKANYKNIAEVIAMRVGTEGIAEYIRRLVFSTLIGNADMHLKNWSVIYPDKHKPTLAPAYDLLSTIPYIADTTMALRFVKTKNMADLSLALLSDISTKAILPERLVLKTAKETVKCFRDVWQTEIKHLPISQATADLIFKNAENTQLWNEVT